MMLSATLPTDANYHPIQVPAGLIYEDANGVVSPVALEATPESGVMVVLFPPLTALTLVLFSTDQDIQISNNEQNEGSFLITKGLAMRIPCADGRRVCVSATLSTTLWFCFEVL